MPYYQSNLFFTNGAYGWVEEFFQLAADIPTALNNLGALAKTRAAVMSSTVGIWKVRVSQVGSPHTSWFTSGAQGTLAGPALAIPDTLLIRLKSGVAGLHRREYHLRGLPSDFFVMPGQSSVNVRYLKPMNAFQGVLESGLWLMKVLSYVGSEVPILGIAFFANGDNDPFADPLNASKPTPGTAIVVAQTNQPDQPQAQMVRVRNVLMSPKNPITKSTANGVFPILNFTGQGVTYAGKNVQGTYLGGGLLQLEAEAYEPITSAELGPRALKKTGPAPRNVGIGKLSSPATGVGEGISPGPTTPPKMQFGPRGPGRVVQTARQLVELIFEGYPDPTHEGFELIQLAKVTNAKEPTWLVCLCGVDNSLGARTLEIWMSAVLSWAGQQDTVLPYIRQIILLNTDPGDHVILCGHSMGGMECEWLKVSNLSSIAKRNPIDQIVTFGSASIAWTSRLDTSIVRFAVTLDPLPYCSPGGYWNWAAIPAGAITSGKFFLGQFFRVNGNAPFHVYVDVPDDYSLNPIDRHNGYPDYPSLDLYNWNGSADPEILQDPLILGPIQTFLWPPP